MDKVDKKQILKDCLERGSLNSLEQCIAGITLTREEMFGVLYALMSKRLVISFDTGLGKTVIASALINLIVSRGEKAIFILKRETLEELYKKLKGMINKNLKVTFITSQANVIFRAICNHGADLSDVLVISSDAIQEKLVNDFLYMRRSDIKMVVVDEMHLFANLESVESRLMNSIIQKAEYAYALTATPLQRDVDQIINTAFIFKRSMFGDLTPRKVYNRYAIYSDGKVTGYRDLDHLKKALSPILLIVTRDMLGIADEKVCTIHKVQSKPDWKDLKAKEAVKIIKSDLTGQPFFKLVELLETYTSQGKKGIIYINQNIIKEQVYNRLQELGYTVGIYDGYISTHKSREIDKELYKLGVKQILIINTPTSLDLEGDFAIFYELTLEYFQFIGRLSRTYNKKQIYIDFIIANETYEEKFFLQHVYKPVLLAEKLCGKNATELRVATEEILM